MLVWLVLDLTFVIHVFGHKLVALKLMDLVLIELVDLLEDHYQQLVVNLQQLVVVHQQLVVNLQQLINLQLQHFHLGSLLHLMLDQIERQR